MEFIMEGLLDIKGWGYAPRLIHSMGQGKG